MTCAFDPHSPGTVRDGGFGDDVLNCMEILLTAARRECLLNEYALHIAANASLPGAAVNATEDNAPVALVT